MSGPIAFRLKEMHETAASSCPGQRGSHPLHDRPRPGIGLARGTAIPKEMGDHASELRPVAFNFDQGLAKLGLFRALRERFL